MLGGFDVFLALLFCPGIPTLVPPGVEVLVEEVGQDV